MYYIHPSSVVETEVVIGEGSRIWHFCHIMEHSVIGEDCIIGQNCFIAPRVRIGNGCKIQNNVSVYQGVMLEDKVFVGPSVVFTNTLNPRAFIEKKDAFIQTTLRTGCSIGANATILCGVEIGEYALVGAGSVVNASVGAFCVVVGNPARVIGYVDMAGERLHFNANNRAISNYDGSEYALENGSVRLVRHAPIHQNA